jgi:hypothetical protein
VAAEGQTRKTQLEYNLTAYDTVMRIWRYFLTDEKPTMRTLYWTLNEEGFSRRNCTAASRARRTSGATRPSTPSSTMASIGASRWR